MSQWNFDTRTKLYVRRIPTKIQNTNNVFVETAKKYSIILGEFPTKSLIRSKVKYQNPKKNHPDPRKFISHNNNAEKLFTNW